MLRVLHRYDHSHGHAQELVQRTHGVGVTVGKVIVHRHYMNALAGQRIEINRQGGNKGLALTGFHLGNLAFVQCHTADQLDIKVAHAHHTFTSLTHDGEGFRQQRIQRLASGQALLELVCFRLQLFITQCIQAFFEGVDRSDNLTHSLQFTVVLASKQLFH